MSKNPFAPHDGGSPVPNRNVFDLSHVNFNTCNYGDCKVVYCDELIPSDSTRIRPTIKIRSQPILFPVGTRMRAFLNFYVVRHRTLWKDWKDFITRVRTDLTPPYLKLDNERAKQMISVGSLGDSLGVPCSVAGDHPVRLPVIVSDVFNFLSKGSSTNFNVFNTYDSYVNNYLTNYKFLTNIENAIFSGIPSNEIFGLARSYRFDEQVFSLPDNLFSPSFGIVSSPTSPTCIFVYVDGEFQHHFTPTITATADGGVSISIDSDTKDLFLSSKENGTDFVLIHWFSPFGANITDITSYTYYSSFVVPYFGRLGSLSQSSYLSNLYSYFSINGVIDSTDDRVISDNPFVGDTPDIPLSALPFRAYEMVYNYFYRNDQNNPYILNGDVKYNEYIPSINGGADTNLYIQHRRNWELDAYTSAVPSPQFGIAPLVGLTYSGRETANLTFQGTDSDGQVNDYEVTVGVDRDGQISSIVDYDKDIPSGNLRTLADLSSYGISINDFRNVNSMQRFLENMLRKGSFRYHSQMEAHFGIRPGFPDVDVPQYIGGVSSDLTVSQITNMAEGAAPLGDVSGQIDALFSSDYDIDFFADGEHCFVLGILSIVPIPSYSQVLRKMFMRYSAFDYFMPEFSKIGYVPIFRSELCPLQSENKDEVFAYQMANYEYMSRNDEIHGDFLTTLRDFTLTRTFKDEPQLNSNFTVVDPNSLNNIFAVDGLQDKYGSSDKFMIWCYFDVKSKRPIPRRGVPSLE